MTAPSRRSRRPSLVLIGTWLGLTSVIAATPALADHQGSAPVAAFTAAPDPGIAAEPVTLDASTSSDPDGDALTYAWDYPDIPGDQNATGVTVTHTFASAGEHAVVLRATDTAGHVTSVTKTVRVLSKRPVAKIKVTMPADPYVGEVVKFDGTTSTDPEGGVLTYAWDFGDGSITTGPKVEHAYSKPGTYTATLTVKDPDGTPATATAEVVIANRVPEVVATATPDQVVAGNPIRFDASGSSDPDGEPLTITWDFGDATTATGPVIDHVYRANGAFEVRVTVTDPSGGSAATTVPVTIDNAVPVARLTPAVLETVSLRPLTLDASTSTDVEGPLTFAWDLGDDTTAEGAIVQHAWDAPGTYTVTLVVTDEDGATDTLTRDVEVGNAAPHIIITTDLQTRPGVPLTIDATRSFDPEGDAFDFDWSAPGSKPDNGDTATFTVTYTDEGTYPITVTLTDVLGNAQPLELEVLVDFDLVERVNGPSRVETAVALARRAFPSATEVVLARADAFPDALAASALAARIDGPVLLTNRNALHEALDAELTRLGVTRAYLAGGTGAIGPEVAAALEARGITVTRLAGTDRFATAAAIAKEAVARGGDPTQVIVALGEHVDETRAWPDALVAGNLATTSGAPILLTRADAVPAPTLTALASLKPTRVWIPGGEGAVGRAVEVDLRERGYDPRRLAGPDRYGTAVVVADEARRQGAGTDPVIIASGRNFPDALAASVVAWKLGGVLLLVDPNSLANADATSAWLHQHRDEVDTVILAGGPKAVSEETRNGIRERIQDR